jgi:hypothetical protein
VVRAKIVEGNLVGNVYKNDKGKIYLNIIRITAIWEV